MYMYLAGRDGIGVCVACSADLELQHGHIHLSLAWILRYVTTQPYS
jgi:hypothetical protein